MFIQRHVLFPSQILKLNIYSCEGALTCISVWCNDHLIKSSSHLRLSLCVSQNNAVSILCLLFLCKHLKVLNSPSKLIYIQDKHFHSASFLIPGSWRSIINPVTVDGRHQDSHNTACLTSDRGVKDTSLTLWFLTEAAAGDTSTETSLTR